MSRSSCLCGDVSWDLDGPYLFMHHCHCSRCRKAHGTPFATYLGAPADAFRLHGADHVATWAANSAAARSFCGRCGSVVPGPPMDGLIFAPAGNFDEDPGERPGDHIFVASKAAWYTIPDRLERHDAYPPGVDIAAMPDPPRTPPPAGTVGGSCLCGAVAYVIDTAPSRAHNCHCGRCRKARSAAHAANLFVPLAGLRFLRGEEQRASYKVPDAERFTQTFCRHCGSPVPQVIPERRVASVPMGSLDDPPAMTPQFHIFVGSKAPWFEIADDLPQHAEYPPS